MSMITPAGHKNVDWAPKDGSLQKTASTEGKEDVNPLYEAAKNYLQAKKAQDEMDNKEEVETSEVASKLSGSIADAVKKVEEKAEAAEAKVEAVGVAVEQVEQAIQSVKDVCGKVEENASGKDEIEVEVEDVGFVAEEPKEVEIDIDVQDDEACEDKDKEVCEDKEKGQDIVVESEPEVVAKSSKMAKSAVTDEEFCRYSMISDSNRKKLVDYWVNALGYPKDYVKLLVKDYEG